MIKRILLAAGLLLGLAVTAAAQDTTAPVCGVNNNSANIIPSGASVTRVNGTTTVSWHDFVTQPLAVGDYWTDLAYGCFAKMLTNSVTLNKGQVHNYALSPAMDRSDCYVLAFDADAGLSTQYIIATPTQSCSGGFGTWGQTVLSSGQMPARTSHSEFAWDYFTGGKFWFINGSVLQTCTITGIGTTSCSSTHTFSEYSGGQCIFPDYTSMNSNGFVDLICQNTSGGTMDIFAYDTVHNVKGGPYTTTCTGTTTSNQPGCIHKLAGPSPSNGIMVQFSGNGCSAEAGNHWLAYPTPTSPMPQVECGTDHLDVMANFSGQDVAALEDFLDNPGPWAPCTHPNRPTLVRAPLSGNPGCMFDNGSVAFGWDVGTRDWPIRPWITYSVQGSQGNITNGEFCNGDTSYADPASGNWNALENEMMLVRVDANGDYSKIWRLGLTHQRGRCGPTAGGNPFYHDPRAPSSIDGKYIVYSSNMRWASSFHSAPVVQTDIIVVGGSVNGGGALGPLFSGTLAPPTNLKAVPIVQPLFLF